MPRGEPRSVPDPVGEGYDAMLRLENVKKQHAERMPSGRLVTEYFSPPNGHRLDFLHEAPRRGLAGTGDGGETDAPCVYVRPGHPPASQAELEERRPAVERVAFMVDHPIAGAAYGVASLVNASPRLRDRALALGGLVDAAMVGAAPRGAPIHRSSPPPRGQLAPPSLLRPSIRIREANASGQAVGVNATLTSPMLGTGTRVNPRRTPPGWQGAGDVHNEARAHLLAKRLGGSGGDLRNLVTLTHQGANTPQMSSFEGNVARRVRSGEVVEYAATPLYSAGVAPPSAVLVTALGSRGAPSARIISNPAARPR